MTNERGPPCVWGPAGLMGIGPGRGIPWGGGDPCGLGELDGGVHLVGSGGMDLTPVVSDEGPVAGRSEEPHFDGTGEDCEP